MYLLEIASALVLKFVKQIRGSAAVSVILLILTAGFFSEAAERYLSVIHGGAALAGALRDVAF
jgi:hypothetical protein